MPHSSDSERTTRTIFLANAMNPSKWPPAATPPSCRSTVPWQLRHSCRCACISASRHSPSYWSIVSAQSRPRFIKSTAQAQFSSSGQSQSSSLLLWLSRAAMSSSCLVKLHGLSKYYLRLAHEYAVALGQVAACWPSCWYIRKPKPANNRNNSASVTYCRFWVNANWRSIAVAGSTPYYTKLLQ